MLGSRTRRAIQAWSFALSIHGCSLPPVSSTAIATEEPRSPASEPASSDGQPYFSGIAALERVEMLMGWPRGLGDARRGSSIDAMAEMLAMAGLEGIERHEFSADDPTTGEHYALVNLVGHLRPDARRRFVLATHFDTRPWADEEEDPAAHLLPVPGANDGTSGVAVILELLPVLAEVLPAEVGVTVILFDGEELGHPGQGGYCMGSRHFAAQAIEDRPAWLEGAEFGIVLDMVGDRDLHVPIEPRSADNAPALVERLWTVAERRGHVEFEDRRRPIGILDDHEFLTRAGVPSVLIIDKEYEPWHTRRDTISEISAESLAAVGDTLLYTLIDLAAVPLQ